MLLSLDVGLFFFPSGFIVQCNRDHGDNWGKQSIVLALHLGNSLPLSRASATSYKFQYTIISFLLYNCSFSLIHNLHIYIIIHVQKQLTKVHQSYCCIMNGSLNWRALIVTILIKWSNLALEIVRKQILCAPDVFQYEVHMTTYEVFWQKMLKLLSLTGFYKR